MADAAVSPPEKCPCCDNPWSKGTADMFAQLCAMCEETKKEEDEKKKDEEGAAVVPALSRSNMDASVDPSDNFYEYANGGWTKSNPIPPGYPSWNTFLHLHVQSQERLKDMLEGLGDSTEGTTEDEAKVAAYYAAAMDEETIEREGTGPLGPLLDLCRETAGKVGGDGSASDLARCIGRMKAEFGVEVFFGIGAGPDYQNSDHSICQVGQGGLGLPDRDYYFDDDKEEKRAAYKEHVARMLTLLEDPAAAAAAAAAAEAPGGEEGEGVRPTDASKGAASAIYDLERNLAEAHMTKTECRDPGAVYNKTTVTELAESCDGAFDFASYFESSIGMSPSDLGDINVRNVDAIKRAAEIISAVDAGTLESYLRWHSVRSVAQYVSEPFVYESFDFNERIMAGTKEIKPRWKRAMAFTESALGEALGKLYCARYFDEGSKARALAMVENVRQALEDRLGEVEWMTSKETRENALKKMGRFKVKIGFPDEWIDYGTLKIESGEPFLSMVFKARAFDLSRDVKEMNAPTDKNKWFMTPQTVNAYYHPNLNEIVFPAAILQPPMFNPDADDAVNYGAMGAVIGHEMTHGFDDKGRKFNFEGNMLDWWTEADGKEYENRVKVMVDQANSFEVHGQPVKGELTCGENIADLGGLRLSLRAFKSLPGAEEVGEIDGFTPTQRFFLSWAQAWRQNITKERAMQLITLDPHGPNEMRCNGPLSNMPEFHEAFGIKEGTPMYKPPEVRVDIW